MPRSLHGTLALGAAELGRALRAVTRGPAAAVAREQVQHDSGVEPALRRPVAGDVGPRFLSGPPAVKSCTTRSGASDRACSLSVMRLKHRLGRAIGWFSRRAVPPDLMTPTEETAVPARAAAGAALQREGRPDVRAVPCLPFGPETPNVTGPGYSRKR